MGLDKVCNAKNASRSFLRRYNILIMFREMVLEVGFEPTTFRLWAWNWIGFFTSKEVTFITPIVQLAQLWRRNNDKSSSREWYFFGVNHVRTLQGVRSSISSHTPLSPALLDYPGHFLRRLDLSFNAHIRQQRCPICRIQKQRPNL